MIDQGFTVEHDGDYAAALDAAADAGFDFLELNMEAAFSRETVDAERVRDGAAERGLDLVVHLPFTVDLGSPHPHAREGAIREIEASIDAAESLGASVGVIHARSLAKPFHWEHSRVVDAIHDSVQRLHEYGRERGVAVCAENLKGDFVDVADFPALFDATDAAMCLDTGHAFVSGFSGADQADFLREHGDRVAHVHLNETRVDAEDEHLPVAIGEVDFAPIARALVETGWEGTCTHELFSYDDSFGYVRESKRRFDELLSEAQS